MSKRALPSSTMAIVTPGTPNPCGAVRRAARTRWRGGARGRRTDHQCEPIHSTRDGPSFNMDLLLEWIRLGLERQRLHVRGSLATTTEKPTAVTRRWQVLHNIGWCAPASISRNLVRSCHWYGWRSYACRSHLVMGRLRWSGPDGAVQQRALVQSNSRVVSAFHPRLALGRLCPPTQVGASAFRGTPRPIRRAL